MKAVILAGGLGSRLKPFTDIIPKPLLPVGESSVMEIQVNGLARCGVREIYIATNYRADYVQAFLGDGSKYGVQLHYSKEEKRLGTCGPVGLLPRLQPHLPEPRRHRVSRRMSAVRPIRHRPRRPQRHDLAILRGNIGADSPIADPPINDACDIADETGSRAPASDQRVNESTSQRVNDSPHPAAGSPYSVLSWAMASGTLTIVTRSPSCSTVFQFGTIVSPVRWTIATRHPSRSGRS